MKITTITLLATLGLASGLASAATVEVGPANMGDWAFYTTDASGTINTGSAQTGFTNGPATPPLGSGSAALRTTPGGGDGSAQLRNDAFAGTRLGDLTSLSYSTYATDWNGSQLPYMTIWLDLDGNGSRDDRLWFEPTYSDGGYGNGNPNPQAPVALNTWQTWDVLTGMVYNDNGPSGPGANAVTFAAYVAANPDATIIDDAGQGIGGIRIATGFASSTDKFKAYVDNVTIGTAASTTTYDFNLPEPTSLALLGGASVLLRRRK